MIYLCVACVYSPSQALPRRSLARSLSLLCRLCVWMPRESMGGEGVQVSDASKTFQQQQQQHFKQQQQNMSSSSMATSSSSATSASSSYAQQQQHYSANAAVSPSSTTSSGSDDGQQQQRANTNRNNMSSGMDTTQQHAQYQHQIMNAAAVMNSGGGAMSQVTCLVCYNAQVDVMLEPCHHQFHAHCIDRWLNKDKVCPICWIPIQNQRRMAVPAAAPTGLYNPQQQASQADVGGGPQPPQNRAAYVPNTANSGSMGAMTASNSNSGAPGAPTDIVGGLAGVANMTNEPPNPATMRKGKWTTEESLYCDRLIEEFKKGNLPLAEGTTLRTFLSKLLNCDPMRISKKYTGDQCIGKIIFRRREDDVAKDDMGLIRSELAELEKTYLEREQYNQRRREKRLESELSRDKSRYIAARTLGGYNSNSNNSGSTPTSAVGNAVRPQMPVPVAPVGHYQQHQQQQIVVSAPMAPKDLGIAASHHAPFPPTRGPMPLQHPSNASIPRYPLHTQQQQHTYPQQQHAHQLQHQQHQHHSQQQQPMQATSGHLFNSSLQSSSSASSGPHYSNPNSDNSSSAMGAQSSSSHSSSHSGNNEVSGRPSVDSSLLSSSDGSNTSSSQGSSSQQHQQQQQQPQQPQQHQEQQQQQSESFPRVSSIDSFSCLFPRVASIDNFQLPHQGGHNNNSSNTHHQYGSNSGNFGDTLGNYDHANHNMVKSISIGDGLNAYFPRIQSLEQLSSLLQEHAPPSPRAKDENESGTNSNNSSTTMKEEGSSSSASGLADRKRMFNAHNSSSHSLSQSHMKEEQQRDAESDLHRRLSPNDANNNRVTEHSNQIQIPKPLSKMPRSSSGIFPRIPSMDKLPRVPSMDKLPRIPSMDKLSSMDRIPRIPSMDKLPRVPSMDKLSSSMPRIPSHSDMLSRFGSSDHLSSFPSFSNLSSLSTCASFTNLSSLSGSGGGGSGGGGSGYKSGFPRNSSIEDILSLVASSENGSGMSSAGSHLQLSALAAVAGEESSQMAAAADRKRRLEHHQAQEMENKKNKLST